MQWVCLAVRQLLILASFTVIKGMEPSIQADTLRFTSEPNSTIYVQSNANSSFLVPCEAAGDAPLKTGWRNETVLNWRVVINTTTKGLWFIHGVQRLGSSGVHRVGIFRCMAYNTAGVVMSKKFQLNFIYLQNISVHLSSPALFSNVVRLKCTVETNQPVKYAWFKDNIALSVSRDSRLDVLPSGVLRIRDYNTSDDGNYSCRAGNSYKVITSRSMKVVGQAASKDSIHTYPGKIIQAMVGSPLIVECIESSPQKSFVTWSKLTAQASTTLVTHAGFADLVFDAVQKSDAGKYRCSAANGKEETVVVSVGTPPSFVNKLPTTTTLNEEEVLVLTCNVSGNPTPSVTWYRDGRALLKDSRTHFNISGWEHQLVVKNTASGVYQCEAENMYGSSVDQTIVNVQAKMDPPRNVKGYALSPNMVNITWENPPGYGTVYFVVVHVLDFVRMKDFQEVVRKLNTTYHLIRNLSPYTEYAIFVQLYAADGKVRGESNAYWIKTLEAAPRGPPNELKLTSYSRGTLDVTWLPPFIFERNGEIIGYEIWYSVESDNMEKIVNVTKHFYSTTLRNLVVGAKYTVRIRARTKKGLGPFSRTVTGVVSRMSTGDILPAPFVSFRSINKSIVVMVTPPLTVKVKEYKLTYRFLKDYLGEEKVVTIAKTEFDYELKNLGSNLEYVITVTAFDSKMSKGRPAIMIVSTKNVPVKVNYTMFKTSNSSDQQRLKISCEPTMNSTAIFVTWQKVPTSHVPEFKVLYSIFGDQITEKKATSTKYYNMTIDDVLPGRTYTIEIKTIFPDHPIISYSSASRLRGTHSCKVPEKKPETPPSEINCTIVKHSVEVTWRAPTKPNGQIRKYNIRWLSSESKEIKRMVPVENSFTETSRDFYSETISSVKIDSNFIVIVTGENSAGQSPSGYCKIDTTTIPTDPPIKNNDKTQTDTDDIEKGIIIGCIISVLVLFILVMFVCWSGCRRHEKKKQMKEDIPTAYFKSRPTPYADTVSTEVSELSTKHHHTGKKYGDEETSKESDRGVGMTPKSSRLYLNSEKIPFLPRAVNPDGSVDTSCDSQDSGVQGLGKKLSATQVALNDPDKTPLHSEDCLVETIF